MKHWNGKKSGLQGRDWCLLTQKVVGRHTFKKIMTKCRIITDIMRA